MGWFKRLCRNTGLMIHNVRHPDKDRKPPKDATRREVISKKVEEKQLNQTTTLRRTTIEEVEIREDPGQKSGSGEKPSR